MARPSAHCHRRRRVPTAITAVVGSQLLLFSSTFFMTMIPSVSSFPTPGDVARVDSRPEVEARARRTLKGKCSGGLGIGGNRVAPLHMVGFGGGGMMKKQSGGTPSFGGQSGGTPSFGSTSKGPAGLGGGGVGLGGGGLGGGGFGAKKSGGGFGATSKGGRFGTGGFGGGGFGAKKSGGFSLGGLMGGGAKKSNFGSTSTFGGGGFGSTANTGFGSSSTPSFGGAPPRESSGGGGGGLLGGLMSSLGLGSSPGFRGEDSSGNGMMKGQSSFGGGDSSRGGSFGGASKGTGFGGGGPGGGGGMMKGQNSFAAGGGFGGASKGGFAKSFGSKGSSGGASSTGFGMGGGSGGMLSGKSTTGFGSQSSFGGGGGMGSGFGSQSSSQFGDGGMGSNPITNFVDGLLGKANPGNSDNRGQQQQQQGLTSSLPFGNSQQENGAMWRGDGVPPPPNANDFFAGLKRGILMVSEPGRMLGGQRQRSMDGQQYNSAFSPQQGFGPEQDDGDRIGNYRQGFDQQQNIDRYNGDGMGNSQQGFSEQQRIERDTGGGFGSSQQGFRQQQSDDLDFDGGRQQSMGRNEGRMGSSQQDFFDQQQSIRPDFDGPGRSQQGFAAQRSMGQRNRRMGSSRQDFDQQSIERNRDGLGRSQQDFDQQQSMRRNERRIRTPQRDFRQQSRNSSGNNGSYWRSGGNVMMERQGGVPPPVVRTNTRTYDEPERSYLHELLPTGSINSQLDSRVGLESDASLYSSSNRAFRRMDNSPDLQPFGPAHQSSSLSELLPETSRPSAIDTRHNEASVLGSDASLASLSTLSNKNPDFQQFGTLQQNSFLSNMLPETQRQSAQFTRHGEPTVLGSDASLSPSSNRRGYSNEIDRETLGPKTSPMLDGFSVSRSNPDVIYANKDCQNELAALASASSQNFPPTRSNNGFGSFSANNGVGGSSAMGQGMSGFGQNAGQSGFPPDMNNSVGNGLNGNFGSRFSPNTNGYDSGMEPNAFSGGNVQNGNFGSSFNGMGS